MKILFVVPYVPNLVRPRSYNMIRFLHQQGHQVHLVTLWSSVQEQQELKVLEPWCASITAFPIKRWMSLFNCLLIVPTREPLQAAYCWNPAVAKHIRQMVQSAAQEQPFDIIHVEHLRGVRYALDLARHADLPKVPPIVWDSVDCISYLFKQAARYNSRPILRFLMGLEAQRTEGYEKFLPTRFKRVLITSIVDRDIFYNLSPENAQTANIRIIPTGVDIDYFCPNPGIAREPDTLLITGKMSYHANKQMALTFAREMMPLIWAKKPTVKLWIVGKDPDAAVQALAQDQRITVTGMVPDLRPYLQKATISVAPLVYGAGIQNKILEAMACATPVVAAQRTVAALTNAVPGQDLVTAADNDSFVHEILTLLADPQRRVQMGHCGRSFVEKNFSWRQVVSKMVGVYEEAMKSATY